MAVTHSAQAKVSIGNAIKDDIEDSAGTPSTGNLVLMTTSSAIRATLSLNTTSCGTVNGTTGVLTFGCTATTPYEDTSTIAGTVTKAQIRDHSNNVILNCSVGTTGEDINLSNNVFGTGDTVQITSLTYTPPS